MSSIFYLSVLALLLSALAAQAEPVTGEAAGKLLFPAKPVAVEMLPQEVLSDSDAAALKMVGGGQPYYGAIAISPSEGMMVEATVAAVNHHSLEAADAAALKGCEDKRKGAKPCIVVAHITPEGWAARDLQLSADATAAFGEHYAAPGALAVSPSTGNFGMAKGEGAGDAAVAACAEKAKARDCAVVILN